MLLPGCAASPIGPLPDAPRPLGYTDLTDEFDKAYDLARASGAEATLIAGLMAEHLPGFYDLARFGNSLERFEDWFNNYLPSYPAEREAIATVSRRFAAMFDPAVADFERRIGSLPTDTLVFLVVSMGEFDGARRELEGRTCLLFGADMIARYHGGDARAFVQHELFHIYHGQRFSGCDEVWCSLWSEGLAVYAARALNPGASDAELLLTIPVPIRPALEAHREEAVCMVLQRLDSTDGDDWNALFSSGRLSANLPPRFGYMVGMWVAEDLGRTRSLRELAQLNGPALRAAVDQSLHGMADCR